MARLTDEDYAEMAADYAAHPPTADEVVGEPFVDSSVLRTGRPPKSVPARGNTPTTSVRLPVELRADLERLAASEGVRPAEIIRRAVSEYVDRQPGPKGPARKKIPAKKVPRKAVTDSIARVKAAKSASRSSGARKA